VRLVVRCCSRVACDDASHRDVAHHDVAGHRDVQRQFSVAAPRPARSRPRRRHGRITLTQIGPPADVLVGLGVGIPQSNGRGVLLSPGGARRARRRPQITVAVEAGTYCVRLFDTGAADVAGGVHVTIVARERDRAV
jgi:hypothetical protein